MALASCVDGAKCSTGACVTEKCADTLRACVDSSKLKPADAPPLEGAPPRGSVPADLIGEWSATTDGSTGRLILNADGTGSWYRGFSYYPNGGSSGCLVMGSTLSSGNVVVQEAPSGSRGNPPYGKITVYATTVEKSFRNCAGGLENTSEPPAVVQLEWYRDYDGSGYENKADPNLIFMIDADCAAKYPGQASPIAMYCTTRVRRR